jgi:hypothetical protein
MSRANLPALPTEQAVAYLVTRWNLTEELARRRYQRELDSVGHWTASEPDMKAAALWYASKGMPVFPVHEPMEGVCSCQKLDCDRPGKHPRTQHGFLDATTDLVQVSEWWDQWPKANIGIPTGAASGLLVVDMDPRNGGDDSLESLILEHGRFPDTAEQATGGGGRHIAFQFSGGTVPKALAPGIDLKADGGYIVVAPSRHASGNRYQWDGIQGAKALLNPATVPAWLLRFLSQSKTPTGSNAQRARNLSEIIPDGQKHDSIVSLIGTLRRKGATKQVAFAACRALQFESPVSDWNIWERVESVYRLYTAHASDKSSQSGIVPVASWPEPIPFVCSVAEPLPPECLPDWLGEMARAVSETTETPFALAALLAVTVASACVAAKAEVRPEPDYAEPLNVFTCAAMESGNRKTAVFTRLLEPLAEWERDAIERIEPMRRQVISDRRTLEARIDRLRKKAASAKDAGPLMREIDDLERKLPTPPTIPRLYVDDCTPEGLAPLMAEQCGRMAVFSDEGGVFDLLAGRYSKGVPNLDLWLKGHSVSPVRIDRADRTRSPVLLDRPHLTVGLSPQPEVLRSLRDKPGFRSRGLLARFLYGMPKSPLGYRTLEPRPVSSEIERQYRRGIRWLIEFKPARTVVLKLSEAAYAEWKEFQHAIETEFRDGGKLQNLKDWGSKLPGAAVRLAGIFHLVQQADRSELESCISRHTMQSALDLASCLISHVQCVFALMDRDPNVESAEKLMAWIIRQGQPSFTVRDCFRAHQGRFKRVDAMLHVLALLEQHGYIRRVSQTSGGGRTPSDICGVNPAVLKRDA